MAKYNISELCNRLKSLVGKEVEVDVAENNGKMEGRGQIMQVYHHVGPLERVSVVANSIYLVVDGFSFPLISNDDNGTYQCGVALLIHDGEVVYKNLGIIRNPNPFKATCKTVFDEESCKSLDKSL